MKFAEVQSAGLAGETYKVCAKCTLDDRIKSMRADKMKSESEVLRVNVLRHFLQCCLSLQVS